jgi:hypothetical protein
MRGAPEKVITMTVDELKADLIRLDRLVNIGNFLTHNTVLAQIDLAIRWVMSDEQAMTIVAGLMTDGRLTQLVQMIIALFKAGKTFDQVAKALQP